MGFSLLQKFILKQCFLRTGRKIPKRNLQDFYSKKIIRDENILRDITKSIDRLIERDLLVGIGRKTAKKWMISEIELTRRGRGAARKLVGVQEKLPLFSKK